VFFAAVAASNSAAWAASGSSTLLRRMSDVAKRSAHASPFASSSRKTSA
jgi:hypothetical protein